MITLLALHGFSQNGGLFRAQLGPLLGQLPAAMQIEVPDAPHACSQTGVARLERMLGDVALPAPHLSWWDATDDGRIYRGWEESLARLRTLAADRGALGLLGFSQGAIVASTLAALAARGEFPPLRFVVLVAGRKPRAELLQPLFTSPLATPSLHVWGERDAFAMSESPKLLQAFDGRSRESVQWPGPHIVPTHGPAAEAIVRFLLAQLGA